MSCSRADIEHLATLARLQLSSEEVERLTHEIGSILAYVDRLQAVDTSSVEDGPAFFEHLPPDRDIVSQDASVAERVIQQFPDRVGNLLRVPAVFTHRLEKE